MFESKLKYIYDINISNSMNCLHYNKVNNIAECNLLHDMLKPSKYTKSINKYCTPTIHVCMNIHNGRAKYNNFRILLDSGSGYATVIRSLAEKHNPKKDAVMKCYTKSVNIITNLKVKYILLYLNLVQRKL